MLGAGKHRADGLRLPSNLDLHLGEGAVLVFSVDYDAHAGNRTTTDAEKSDRAMLFASRAKAPRISGPGMILAPGPASVKGRNEAMRTLIPSMHRPRVLVLEDCTDITLSGFSLRAAPMWTLHLFGCVDVSIEDLSIENDREMPSNDGIVLKTSARPPGEVARAYCDILTSDCTVESWSCALKLGTESHGLFERIEVRDCTVRHSNRAVGLFSRDGGALADIAFRRIAVDCRETPDGYWGSGEAVTVNVLARHAETPAGRIENVLFEGISGSMQGAVNIVGEHPGAIRNVRLDDVLLIQTPGAHSTAAYDLRTAAIDVATQAALPGWANAWVRTPQGTVAALVPDPGRMPGLYALNVVDLSLD